MTVGFTQCGALPLRHYQRRAPLCSPSSAPRQRVPQRRRSSTVVALFGRKQQKHPEGFALGDVPKYSFDALRGLREALSKPGAYAVRDENGVLQYVGYAKDVYRRLEHHSRAVSAQMCGCFHTYVPNLPKQDVTPDLLEGVLEYWVAENGGMPIGNTRQRSMWESFGQNTESASNDATTSPNSAAQSIPDPTIPVRERTTPKRRAARTNATDAGMGSAAASASGVGVGATANSGSGEETWRAREEDVIELNVDPLDPFTATKYAQTTREGLWEAATGDGDGDDWIPIFGVVGVATIIWLLSVLGNALPTAAPSLGM